MKVRSARLALLPLALCAVVAMALAACQTEDPPEAQTLLRVSLNDSLKHCEKVVVEVFSRSDSDKVLDTLWNEKLTSPVNQIPAYDVKNLGTDELIVKVTGFRAGQMAVQTLIYYSPVSGRSVRHETLPPLVPLNWLASLQPSVGSLSPAFFKDTLLYLVKLPQDVDSIFFIPKAPNPSVTIQANSQYVQSGKATKTYRIGSSPDTARFYVTDSSTGSYATREYKVAIFPTPPLGLLLATLEPSTGHLGTEFTSDNTIYNLYMPADKDTVSFKLSPLDPKTMTMTLDNRAVYSEVQSQIITVAPGTIYTVAIYVMRAGKQGYYQVTLDHTQKSSH